MTNITENFISSANDNSRYRLYIALFIMCCVAISWLGVTAVRRRAKRS
jgi:hypothetical protein